MDRASIEQTSGRHLMRHRIPTVLVAATAVVALPSTASAALVADWKMDEEGPADATVVMEDSAGTNDGTTHSVITGVPGLVTGSARAYRFDGTTSWVEVPDSPTLDPESADFAVKATVHVEDGQILDDSYDVIRKGDTKTAGGFWKMEIHRVASNTTVGKLRCAYKGILPDGTRSLASKQATPDIVDGRTHTLQCKRIGNTVSAVVDGTSYSLTKSTGRVDNNSIVMVGSKVAGDDVLQGDIDEVSIDKG
jgi:hypothetical protein